MSRLYLYFGGCELHTPVVAVGTAVAVAAGSAGAVAAAEVGSAAAGRAEPGAAGGNFLLSPRSPHRASLLLRCCLLEQQQQTAGVLEQRGDDRACPAVKQTVIHHI